MKYTDAWADEIRKELGALSESNPEDWSGAQLSGDRVRTQAVVRTSKGDDFLERFKRVYLKVQCLCLCGGLMAIVLLPLVQNIYLRVTILTFVMGLVIRLFIVFQENASKKLMALGDQLSALGPLSTRRGIPTYADFGECQPVIEKACRGQLQIGQDLHVDLHVVAATFSWPYLQESLIDWSRAFPERKITFHVALVCAKTLYDWGAVCWANRAESTAAEIQRFCMSTTTRFPNLAIHVYRYDRIPDNHGILINNRILFMGRTEWIPDPAGVPELRVGTRPYMQFSVDDAFGSDKVATFRSWMNRDRLRDAELSRNEEAQAA